MPAELSKPLTTLPSFLSCVAITHDDREATIRGFISAERKSPSRYGPARQLLLSVLQGKMPFEDAVRHAKHVADETERKCALSVLQTATHMLRNELPSTITSLPPMEFALPNGLKMDVKPVWIRHFEPKRLMVLHMWETPFSAWQIRALGGILKQSIVRYYPNIAGLDIDFISVSTPEHASGRRLQKLDWKKISPFDENELADFISRLCDAWSEYQSRGPREIRRRSQPSLL